MESNKSNDNIDFEKNRKINQIQNSETSSNSNTNNNNNNNTNNDNNKNNPNINDNINENENHRKTALKHNFKKTFKSQSYYEQSTQIWPGRGQHILAQFDEDSVIVYQAFKPAIAKYAVEHQKYEGCPGYGVTRMTWIKTNFLWMMFRCGWASKHNQQRVLAIWLKRSAFETYLENAREKGSVRGFKGTIRLQWDPDHFPNKKPHPYRRAVQMGLKNVPTFASGEDILEIQDVTDFVRTQALLVKQNQEKQLLVARERVYTPATKQAAKNLTLDKWNEQENNNDDDNDNNTNNNNNNNNNND